MSEDNRTIYDLVANALDCQDASNLSGVVHSFSRDITRLRTLLNEQMGDKFSTDILNRHPVCVLYSSKIASLSGSETGMRFSRAYVWCGGMRAQGNLKNADGTMTYGELPLPVDAN